MNCLRSEKQPVLVLTGPTASGKSALAVALAEELSGEVISADSMQVYRMLNIATAKISPAEMRGIPHHLLDIVDPDAHYSVADFIRDAEACIRDIQGKGHLPIVCGGTRLYIRSLLDGVHFAETAATEPIRQAVAYTIRADGLDQAYEALRRLDPQAAQHIKPQDEKRIRRFFELYMLTGKTQSTLNQESRAAGPAFAYRAFALMPQREALYARINARTEAMFAAGLLEELEAVLASFPDFPKSQAYQAIGYKEIDACRQGQISRAEAIAALQQASRHLAKQQLSFCRSRQDIHPLIAESPLQALDELLSAWHSL